MTSAGASLPNSWSPSAACSFQACVIALLRACANVSHSSAFTCQHNLTGQINGPVQVLKGPVACTAEAIIRFMGVPSFEQPTTVHIPCARSASKLSRACEPSTCRSQHKCMQCLETTAARACMSTTTHHSSLSDVVVESAMRAAHALSLSSLSTRGYAASIGTGLIQGGGDPER